MKSRLLSVLYLLIFYFVFFSFGKGEFVCSDFKSCYLFVDGHLSSPDCSGELSCAGHKWFDQDSKVRCTGSGSCSSFWDMYQVNYVITKLKFS